MEEIPLMKLSPIFVALVCLSAPSFLSGQRPILLKDLNGSPKMGPGSMPHSFFGIGGRVLFVATGKGVGKEIFVSSGTAAGTRVLADLNPGPKDSDLQIYGVHGGQVLFIRTTPNGGKVSQELWGSDGTPQGTTLIRSGFSGFPRKMVSIRKVTYFFAWDATKKHEVLYRTDGSTKGTFKLFGGNAQKGLSLVRSLELMEWKGSLFFLAFFQDNKGIRLGLFRTDGTQKGTLLILDFPKAVGPATVPAMFPIGGEVGIGLEEPGVFPFALYMSKGRASTTRKVALPAGKLVGSLPAQVASDGFRLNWLMKTKKEGAELWTSAGTAASAKVIDLSPGTKGSRVTLGTPIFGRLLFSAQPDGGVQGLYLSDSSQLGARRLCNLPFANAVRDVAVVGTNFVFANSRPGVGTEPWISDGTPGGTKLLADLEPGGRGSHSRRFGVAMGKVFFASTTHGLGEDPWMTDGTTKGTHVLARLYPPAPGTGNANPSPLLGEAVEGIFYFRAEDPVRGMELWATDGTPFRTKVMGDLEPGRWGSSPGNAIALRGRLLFAATRSGVGRELFASNGDPKKTGLLRDLQPGTGSGDPRDFFRLGQKVFFSAKTTAAGRELWVSDGTPAGTHLLWDLRAGIEGSNPQPLAEFGGNLLFQAESAKGVPGLFLGNGTAQGTVALLDSKKTAGVQAIFKTVALGKSILSLVRDQATGLELWKSLGNKGDGALLVDLFPGKGDGASQEGFVFGKKFFFLGRRGPGIFGLFQSDGTAKGTKPVPAVSAPKTNFQFLTKLPSLERGKLFGFQQPLGQGQSSVDLFLIFRGTGAVQKVGQFTVLDKSLGQVFGRGFPQVGSRFAYFEALDGNGFPRIFRSDGSSGGTHPLNLSSNLKEGRVIGALPKGLLIAGTDSFVGRELFLWDPGAMSLPRGQGCEGTSLQTLDPVLGRPLLLGGEGNGSFGILFAGFPLNPSFQIRASCRFYLNPLGPLPSLPFLVSQGQFASSLALPNLPPLQGFQISLQAAIFNPKSFTLSLTNAMDLRLGY